MWYVDQSNGIGKMHQTEISMLMSHY
jgi:hypothetical protein